MRWNVASASVKCVTAALPPPAVYSAQERVSMWHTRSQPLRSCGGSGGLAAGPAGCAAAGAEEGAAAALRELPP